MQSRNQYKKPIEQGQDIYDLCIQEYGNIEAVFLLLADNPHINLEDKLEPGVSIKFRVELPEYIDINKSQMDFFRNNRIRVNTQETIIYSDGFTLVTQNGQTIVTQSQEEIGGGFSDGTISTPPQTGVTTQSEQIIITQAGDAINYQ